MSPLTDAAKEQELQSPAAVLAAEPTSTGDRGKAD